MAKDMEKVCMSTLRVLMKGVGNKMKWLDTEFSILIIRINMRAIFFKV